MIPDVCALVLAFTTPAIDEDAVLIVELTETVPVVMFAESEVEAFKTLVLVVLMLVLAVARVAPSELEARLVFALIAI